MAAMGSGEVLEVYVNQGEMVEKDQTLFKIDNKQLESARIQLNTAKVSLDDAQTNLNRMKVLYDSGDISAQAYEQVVNGVSMAKLQYDGAKLNYDTVSYTHLDVYKRQEREPCFCSPRCSSGCFQIMSR